LPSDESFFFDNAVSVPVGGYVTGYINSTSNLIGGMDSDYFYLGNITGSHQLSLLPDYYITYRHQYLSNFYDSFLIGESFSTGSIYREITITFTNGSRRTEFEIYDVLTIQNDTILPTLIGSAQTLFDPFFLTTTVNFDAPYRNNYHGNPDGILYIDYTDRYYLHVTSFYSGNANQYLNYEHSNRYLVTFGNPTGVRTNVWGNWLNVESYSLPDPAPYQAISRLPVEAEFATTNSTLEERTVESRPWHYDQSIDQWSLPPTASQPSASLGLLGRGVNAIFEGMAAEATDEAVSFLADAVASGNTEVAETALRYHDAIARSAEAGNLVTNFFENMMSLLDEGIANADQVDFDVEDWESRVDTQASTFRDDCEELVIDDLDQAGRSAFAEFFLSSRLSIRHSDVQIAMSLSLIHEGGTDLLSANHNNSFLGTMHNDIVVGGNLIDVITAAAGNDSLTGLQGNDILYGGSGDDTLYGNEGDDRLSGGEGADSLFGGTGDDSYYIDAAGDLVFELAGDGNDTVYAGANHYLYANVENLTLTGTANNFGVGNELANVLTGNSGENLLIAGAGNDTVNGGAARDAIFGESGDDILNGEAGIDYIVAGLGNDIIDGGADADEIYGQDGDDIMRGGASFDTDIIVGGLGNDTIYGNSSLGDYDRLYGNEGNDVFYVDTPDDLVFEQSGEGTDTVYADINGAGYYLYGNIENLILLDDTPFGVGNDLANQLTGNAAGNYLLGGLGNDILNGMAGNDVLFGEGGSDVFAFGAGTGTDIIGDFERGSDRIDVSSFGLTFAQLQGRFVQVGNDGAIQLTSGETVILHNVTMSQLTASDFILAPVSEGPPKNEADIGGAFVGADSILFADEPLWPTDGLQRLDLIRTDWEIA
jgi:Ca2+-binding RTX toxin-like protein